MPRYASALSLGAFLGFVALLLWLAYSWATPKMDVVAVSKAPLERTLQLSGRVQSPARVEIGSTLTGRVAKVLVEEGDIVEAGQVLIELDLSEMQAQAEQAAASWRQAQARAVSQGTAQKAAVGAALAQAEALWSRLQADHARSVALQKAGFFSQAHLEESERALASAKAALESARAQWASQQDSGSEALAAKAQEDAARAGLLAARSRLEQGQLRSPFKAKVLSRKAEVGQILQPGRVVLLLQSLGPTQLRAQADERYLRDLALGQAVWVLADAFPEQSLQARLSRIAPSVDAQRGAVELHFDLEGTDHAFLKEDMSLSLEILTGRREQTIVLPLGAIAEVQGSQGKVWKVLDGRLQAQTVSLGLRNLGSVEVLSGLSEGDEVLLSGQGTQGQRLRPNRVQAASPVARR